MGQCAEDECRVFEAGFFRRDKCQVIAADANRLAGLPVGCGESQLHPWMLPDEQAELAPRVATGPENPNRKFMHS